MTQDELKVLGDLYGAAQDLHSHLSNRTCVADTMRFWPPIEAAADLLARAAAEPACKHERIETLDVYPPVSICLDCGTRLSERALSGIMGTNCPYGNPACPHCNARNR